MESQAMISWKKYMLNWYPADYMLGALLLVFPVYNKLMPVLILLLAFTLFMQRSGWKETRSQYTWKSPFVWFVVFYFAHVIGLWNTENMSYANNDLGMKASFLLLPVLLAWTKWRLSVNQIVELFLAGLLIACTVAYGYAIFRSIYNPEDNHWAYFTESYFSFFMHRSYFATYLAIGALLSLHRYFVVREKKFLVILFILSVSAVLTFSKAGIILLFAMMVPTVILLSARYHSLKRGLILGALTVVSAVTIFAVSPTIRVRFSKMLEGATSVQTVNNPSVESSASRAIMWTTSVKLFKDHPLWGTGTGDVSDELDALNTKLGNTGVAERSLNSHNQYLNTAVQLGLMGLIPLLMIFISSGIRAIKERFTEGLLLVIMLFLTLLFESFLETQAGIIPVTLLILLFFHRRENNETSDPHTVLPA